MTSRHSSQSDSEGSTDTTYCITLVRALQRVQRNGSNINSSRAGRPRVTSEADDKFICVSSKRDRFLVAPRIREEFCVATGKKVSRKALNINE